MAGAAAKKAAAARKAAADLYLPLLVGINVVYIVVRYLKGLFLPSSLMGWLGLASFAGLQVFAYLGILEDAAKPRAPKDKSLVGGAWLDVVMLTVAIQFLTVLWSASAYWLLLVFPPWGAYSLYRTFIGHSDGGAAAATVGSKTSNASSGTIESEELAARRRKRTERRRQKLA